YFFFFQAEDGIRDGHVTGVQTCALPISPPNPNNIRIAKAIATMKNPNGDLPYGIPVPGKQGFVTSPFSPDSGYIDVRSFQPGTRSEERRVGKECRAGWVARY